MGVFAKKKTNHDRRRKFVSETQDRYKYVRIDEHMFPKVHIHSPDMTKLTGLTPNNIGQPQSASDYKASITKHRFVLVPR